MLPSAIPTAPTNADAPPPPGTGALEASTSTNSSHVFCVNPIIKISFREYISFYIHK
jgi:hypothetical protein